MAIANSLNPDDLGAANAITDNDGLWVLQFNTPMEAKNAVETLEDRGITVEADKYI